MCRKRRRKLPCGRPDQPGLEPAAGSERAADVSVAGQYIDREGRRRRTNGVKSCSDAAARPGRS
eukprot:735454-Prymnesium_polylepis.1